MLGWCDTVRTETQSAPMLKEQMGRYCYELVKAVVDDNTSQRLGALLLLPLGRCCYRVIDAVQAHGCNYIRWHRSTPYARLARHSSYRDPGRCGLALCCRCRSMGESCSLRWIVRSGTTRHSLMYVVANATDSLTPHLHIHWTEARTRLCIHGDHRRHCGFPGGRLGFVRVPRPTIPHLVLLFVVELAAGIR